MHDFPCDSPFPATRWTMVTRSADPDEPTRAKALEELCGMYWRPVYAFVRGKGHSPHDAEDLVQGFFAQLLARNDLARTDPSKGRLRTFLLVAVKNYMANEWRRENRQKRGGGAPVLSLDMQDAESRFVVPEPADETTPDVIYHRHWVVTLLGHVLEELGARYRKDGKGALFDALKSTLTPGAGTEPYGSIAERLGMSEAAVRVAVHRLRQRYGMLLRETIADTLGEDGDPEDEIRMMMDAFD